MTEENTRPNPDILLSHLKAEEQSKKQGKLKIFLGYAAGVGKTYAMLESARTQKNEIDVVVALAETHGREETEALLEGLEVIPRKEISYRSVTITEMDIDAVLARKPGLALVDEMAHTNAPDSRHPKRYQDVEELIQAGINVYTTLNIQHVESLQSVVAQITGVWMHETVPDSVIDRASEIELVDLPPDELIKRLHEGKVYVPEQIGKAIDEFFRKGNLTALRELSMRAAAERVDEQVRAYMGQHAIRGPWPTTERVLVGMGYGLEGSSMIRSGRRLATQLGSEWSVVHVETPDSVRHSSTEQDRLTNNLRLAERMGAKVITIQGNSVAETLSDYAIKNHFTKIIVSKSRRRFTRIFYPSMADRLLQLSDSYDVQIVAGIETEPKDKQVSRPNQFHFWNYLIGLGVVGIATLINWLLRSIIDPTVVMTFYLIGVVISAVFLGLGTSILVSIMSVLAFDFLFIPPRLTFAVADVQYVLTLFALLVVAVIISYFASRLRQQAILAKRHEREVTTLYSLGRELALSNDLESYIHSIMKSSQETFGYETTIFLPDEQNDGILRPHLHGEDKVVNDNDRAAATWSFENQKLAGFGTDTLPDAKARFVPLTTARGTVGVLVLWASQTKTSLTIEQEHLLGAYADLAAVAIERILLAEQAHKAQILETQEKLQTALLNSISHDLHTPLVAIIGALSSLNEEGMGLDANTRHNLIDVALQEGERLNHLLSNLLDMSRIEAGALKLSLQPTEVQDLVGAGLEHFGKEHNPHPVSISIPSDIPYVTVDSGLIVQALINILDNSFKYSSVDSPIEISARLANDQIEIDIADRGVGIPTRDLERVFDKFYRLQHQEGVTGTGLGLSIVKGIVEAHGGTVSAINRPEGGTIIRIRLLANIGK